MSPGAPPVKRFSSHLALAEMDRFGNLVETWRIDLPLRGKSSEQAKAIIGDACVAVAAYAEKAGKPVVVEERDFSKKKAELEAVDAKAAR